MSSIGHYVRRTLAVAREEGLGSLLVRTREVSGGALMTSLSRVRTWLGDAVKAFVLLLILRPAADFLPARWAHSLANLAGFLYSFMPFYGRQECRRLQQVFSTSASEARKIASAMLAQPFRDYIVIRRILRDRERIEDWNIVESNAEVIQPLRDAGASFILASGHFARGPQFPFFLRRIIPQNLTMIVAPMLPKSLNPKNLWHREHFGQMLRYLEVKRPDIDTVKPGQPGLMQYVAGKLQEPGNVLFSTVDAPWKGKPRGSFTRPFASRPGRRFATGIARLARSSQSPIALCIPYYDPNGQIVVDWARVVPPPDPADESADERITSMLLDDIEIAIAKRPSQYVIDFLGPRKWNAAAGRWE